MSVDLQSKSGILASHVSPIAATAREVDAFIFIRKTNLNSTLLIEMGYATKSMDVHDKSSDWGPMAGFVPCDPAFSKVAAVAPGGAQQAAHGKARKTQLVLSNELKQRLESAGRIVVDKGSNEYLAGVKVKDVQQHSRFRLQQQSDGWAVSWKYAPPGAQSADWKPLEVWAYDVAGKPCAVTGDYDLWMVAPHMRHLTSRGFDIGRAAAQENKDAHGSSASSLFVLELLAKLNKACQRAQNPVFQHGAEAQNHGFTQQLDKEVAMFVPGAAEPRMVESTELPAVIADMSKRGYLPIWNKRYGETDPHFGGKSTDQRQQKMREDFADSADRLTAAMMADAQAVKAIADFNKALLKRLESDDMELVSLTEQDLPENAQSPSASLAQMQRRLQQVVVGSSTGAGESRFDELAAFYSDNFSELQELYRFWGRLDGSRFGIAPASNQPVSPVPAGRITGIGGGAEPVSDVLDTIRRSLFGQG